MKNTCGSWWWAVKIESDKGEIVAALWLSDLAYLYLMHCHRFTTDTIIIILRSTFYQNDPAIPGKCPRVVNL